jgi:hypothetical protein
MEIRAWGANRFPDPERSRALSAPPHAGQTGGPSLFAYSSREKDSGSVLLGSKAPLERTLVAPDSPCDACHTISEGDSGDVVTTGLSGLEGPDLKRVGFLGPMGCKKGSPSAVNEEYPEVAVAPLGDGPKPSGTPRG